MKHRTRLSFGIAHASDVCHLSKVETLLQSTSTSICEAILAQSVANPFIIFNSQRFKDLRFPP